MIPKQWTYLITITAGNSAIGQNELRKPASWLPAVRRRVTDPWRSNCATFDGLLINLSFCEADYDSETYLIIFEVFILPG